VEEAPTMKRNPVEVGPDQQHPMLVATSPWSLDRRRSLGRSRTRTSTHRAALLEEAGRR
jgi:hypothetical protein